MRAMRHGRASSWLIFLLVLLAGLPLLLAAPRPAAAQCIICADDTTPPSVSLSPSTGSFTTQTISVTIRWCDEESPLSGTQRITLNGTDVTSHFSFSTGANSNCDNPSSTGNALSTGSVSLASGTNTLTAHICDTNDNCTNRSASYTYTPPPDNTAPTISFSPASGGTYHSAGLTVTVSWGDNQQLDATSHTITLNGQSAGISDYGGSATAATSTGSLTLRNGVNTVSAHICDAADNCTTQPATYTYSPIPPTVTITEGARSGSLQALTIRWSDNVGLDDATEAILFNGDSVTGDFSYGQPDLQQPVWESTGSVTLAAGENLLVAHICDVESACTDRQWSYFADLAPPTVAFDPAGGVTGSPVALTITWCDASPLDESTMDLTTGGGGPADGNVTEAFTYANAGGGCATASGSLALLADTTILTAHICDVAGNCTSPQTVFFLDHVAPTVSISPAATTDPTRSSVAVTVSWSDNGALDLATQQVTLNGASVAGPVPYTGSTSGGTSSGTLTLPGGVNTFTAHVCDAAANCTTESASYTYAPPVTVSLAPTAGADTVVADATVTQHFTLTSSGGPDAGASYRVSAACTPATTPCAVTPDTVTIPKTGGTAGADVTYHTGADGATEHVALTATYTLNGAVTAAGAVDATAQALCSATDVTITPCRAGRIATVLTNGDSVPVTFTITNQTALPASYTLACDAPTPLAGCTAPDEQPLDAGDSIQVTAVVNLGADQGLGTVRLLATSSGGEQVAGSAELEVLSPTSVLVQALGDTLRHLNTGDTASQRFTVQNTGPRTAIYRMDPACTFNVLTCVASIAQDTLAPGGMDTVTVSFAGGEAPGVHGSVGLSATHIANDQITSTAQTDVLVNAYGVTVTAVQDSVTVDVGPHSATFTVRNSSTDSATFVLTTPCVSPVTDCAVPASVYVDSGGSANVNVAYTASTASISGGLVRLRAALARDPAIVSVGTVRISAHTAATGGEPQVALVNSDSLAARALCLTISAGPGAASECGDLRLVHALPSIRTMNKRRTPVLLYNSRFAEPHPLVAVNATLLPDTVAPPMLEATVTIDGDTTTAQWSGSGWGPGTTRRLVIPVADAGLATGVHTYTLQVTNVYPTVRRPSQVVTGHFVVVNRRASPFGAGWWLAGLEQLQFPADSTTRLWVGGDGSVRVYEKVSNGVWAAPAVDRPDTLTWDGTSYIRHLKHGLRVVFDAQGRHLATVNRLADTTTFTYAADTLRTITLPPGGAAHTYTFDYTTPGQVRITAPPAGTTARVTTLLLTDGRITSIRDPDYQFAPNPFFSFGYDSTSARITSRTDKRGTTVSYTYDAAQTLRTVSIPLTETDTATTTFAAAESRGLAPAVVRADSVFTLLDGPRLNVGDTTRFWLDRFGAPWQIHDALGHATVLARTDPTYPALVTRLRQPNGHVVLAAYDARGNATAVADSAPYGGTAMATTTYQWDPMWDFVTQVTGPEGELDTLSYDPATGNRLWQQHGVIDANRTVFRYYESGNDAGLLRAVELPAVPGEPAAIDSLTHDALGNLTSHETARGFWTRYDRDALGRVTTVHRPIGADGTAVQDDSLRYDIVDRVIRSATYGPALNGAPAQEVVLETFYNVNGWRDSVRRSTIPNTVVDTMTTRWSYDLAGRPVAEIAPDGAVDSTRYDLAGSVVWLRTRRARSAADTISMQYDALNRLIRRHLPAVQYGQRSDGIPTLYPVSVSGHNTPYPAYPIAAETATFEYDAMGHLVVADNQNARVHRSYYPNGLLERDSLYIRTIADSAHGGDFTHHAYQLLYSYNLSGQPIDLTHPAQLAPVVDSTRRNHTRYAYDPFTGRLESVTDVLGTFFRFHYDPRGALDSLYRPLEVTAAYGYDPDGNLAVHEVRDRFNTLRHTSLTAGASGKVLATRNQFGKRDTLTAVYSGLGYLIHSERIAHDSVGIAIRSHTSEDFTYDALGNILLSVTADTIGNGISAPEDTNTYEPRTGRLVNARRVGRNDTLIYNAAGDLEFTTQRDVEKRGALEDRVSYYAADGSLRAAHYRTVADGRAIQTLFTTVYEQYRYDALGRRVLVWAQRWCENGALDQLSAAEQEAARRRQAECNQSLVRRTVWDGNRELYEIQMPGDSTMAVDTLENDTAPVKRALADGVLDPNPFFGRVAYAYGLGIDQPLSITRINYADWPAGKSYAAWPPFTILPLWTIRQQADTGFFPVEGSIHRLPTDTTRHAEIDWPLNWRAYGAPDPMLFYWHGTLLDGKRDKAQTMYRRARVYDPETGRFTQEDPIGLAGGLNLYGFANGDPINLSDPFGLTVCFNGTRSEVRSLAFTAKATTNSTFSLDSQNCVIASSLRSLGNSKFNSLRSLFGRFVTADQRFTVKYTDDAFSRQAPFTVLLSRTMEALGYRTGSGFGKCDGGRSAFMSEQVFAHEMIHHEPELAGKPLPAGTAEEERRATIRGDNVFNAAVGRRLRCAYP